MKIQILAFRGFFFSYGRGILDGKNLVVPAIYYRQSKTVDEIMETEMKMIPLFPKSLEAFQIKKL